MEKYETSDPDEDSPIPPEVRAAAASRLTWVSVAVNVALCSAQIAVGVRAKSRALIAGGLHSLA
jgi:divalent metal cation (Fe/Co/Zn/Cd) transporter